MELNCDIELLRDGGDFTAKIEGLTANVILLKSDSLEELLVQLSIELEDTSVEGKSIETRK